VAVVVAAVGKVFRAGGALERPLTGVDAFVGLEKIHSKFENFYDYSYF